jgi:hypothetical protein
LPEIAALSVDGHQTHRQSADRPIVATEEIGSQKTKSKNLRET